MPRSVKDCRTQTDSQGQICDGDERCGKDPHAGQLQVCTVSAGTGRRSPPHPKKRKGHLDVTTRDGTDMISWFSKGQADACVLSASRTGIGGSGDTSIEEASSSPHGSHFIASP